MAKRSWFYDTELNHFLNTLTVPTDVFVNQWNCIEFLLGNGVNEDKCGQNSIKCKYGLSYSKFTPNSGPKLMYKCHSFR